MNILGIGPLELVLIIVIMILVLGPQQMVVTARKAGALFRKVVKSPIWGTIMDTSREIRDIPTKLVREAGLDEEFKEMKETAQSVKNLKNISVTADPVILKDEPAKRSPEKSVAVDPSKDQEHTPHDAELKNSMDVPSPIPAVKDPNAEIETKSAEGPQPLETPDGKANQ
jgi:sec-independent protein translocase protein TatB